MITRKVKMYILCKLDGKEYQPGETYAAKDQERIDYLTELGYLEQEDVEENEEPKTQRSRKRGSDNVNSL